MCPEDSAIAWLILIGAVMVGGYLFYKWARCQYEIEQAEKYDFWREQGWM